MSAPVHGNRGFVPLVEELVPLPDPESQQPYQVAVDSKHQVWTNLWSTDKVGKYDPETNKWTLFDLPTRGTESRYISVLEQPGNVQQGRLAGA